MSTDLECLKGKDKALSFPFGERPTQAALACHEWGAYPATVRHRELYESPVRQGRNFELTFN
jgi:hypothetical protein